MPRKEPSACRVRVAREAIAVWKRRVMRSWAVSIVTGTGSRSASETPDFATTVQPLPSRLTDSMTSSRADTVKSSTPSQRPISIGGSAPARSDWLDPASGGAVASVVAGAAAERVITVGAAAALLTRSSAVEGAGSSPRPVRLSSMGRSCVSVGSRNVPRSSVSLCRVSRTLAASGVTKRRLSPPPVSSTTPATLLR
jgi:hypothetical protein